MGRIRAELTFKKTWKYPAIPQPNPHGKPSSCGGHTWRLVVLISLYWLVSWTVTSRWVVSRVQCACGLTSAGSVFLTFVESDIDLTSLYDRLGFFRAKRTSFWVSLANLRLFPGSSACLINLLWLVKVLLYLKITPDLLKVVMKRIKRSVCNTCTRKGSILHLNFRFQIIKRVLKDVKLLFSSCLGAWWCQQRVQWLLFDVNVSC